jgi:formylglycine-generating enzyme required for sulfatase activity
MARIEKTVFISYRRTDVYAALAVYETLKNQGYDVFFDYRSISSGDFEQIITSNIRARAHFLLILTPTALDRCNEPGDWLRREVEIAIDEKRNIVPLFFRGFRFGDPSVTEKLTGKLKNLSRYNGLNVHEDYFDEAMERLRTQFLNIPLNTVLHPVSTEVQKVVREEQVAADKALEQIEDVKELVKHVEEKPNQPKSEPIPKQKIPVPAVDIPVRRVGEGPNVSYNFRLIGAIAGGLLILSLLIWGGSKLLANFPAAPTEPTSTLQTDVTFTSQPSTATTPQPTTTNTPSPTVTPIPPTPTLGIGSTMTSDKDGMTLLYVPAGEFSMGSDADDALAECQKSRPDCQRDVFTDEEPPHFVDLAAFWIDRTEVTNAMFAKCVEANVCDSPDSTKSSSRDSYFGETDFDDYPVIYVSWDDANAYCEWADRRLPTEAEWEKAARGMDGHVYSWGNTFDGSLANFCDTNCLLEYKNDSFDDGFADTSPVGNYPNGASPYGALDLAGNVWEWVADWYSDTYYDSSPTSNPAGPDSGEYRVLRGGAWSAYAYRVRSANRLWADPTNSDLHIGFRCSRSP